MTNAPNQPIQILIADDHQLVIDGLKLMLQSEQQMECVAEAHNGQEVLDYLQTNPVDIVLLDINMPVLNGVETCKLIDKNFPSVKVIGLSMLKEANLIKLMLKHGAKGYLLKNTGKEEVIEAIMAVATGKKYFGSEVSDLIFNSFSGERSKKKKSPFPQLSRREKQVLQLIVDEYTTGEIAEQLSISFGTVETHRRNLLVKLGARNTAGLVRATFEYELLGAS